MAVCFSLTKQGEDQPSSLVAIDEAICAYMGVEPDPDRYYRDWYDRIGFKLAMGDDWDTIRERYWDLRCDEMVQVINFLEDNYRPSAWAERKTVRPAP